MSDSLLYVFLCPYRKSPYVLTINRKEVPLRAVQVEALVRYLMRRNTLQHHGEGSDD